MEGRMAIESANTLLVDDDVGFRLLLRESLPWQCPFIRIVLTLLFLVCPMTGLSSAGDEASVPAGSAGAYGVAAILAHAGGTEGLPLSVASRLSEGELSRVAGKGVTHPSISDDRVSKIILWDEGHLQYASGVGFNNLGSRVSNMQLNHLVIGGY
jgi:hypothetical protein